MTRPGQVTHLLQYLIKSRPGVKRETIFAVTAPIMLLKETKTWVQSQLGKATLQRDGDPLASCSQFGMAHTNLRAVLHLPKMFKEKSVTSVTVIKFSW
ncbi:hypothetical protein HOLleu_19494 [Holothuria leucospilota]|uniref:Uncharacterized protein n=1 Tax=Holothuria leucospilota TaxID=206669 RepID=A0A9Q1H784_HOLLE|nr:hypothetical protein HOLleu_19494 [Holothuria leucospilota]